MKNDLLLAAANNLDWFGENTFTLCAMGANAEQTLTAAARMRRDLIVVRQNGYANKRKCVSDCR